MDWGARKVRNLYTGQGQLRLIPLLLFGAFFLFYYLANQETVPVTGRRHLVGMSPSQEMQLGLQSFRQVLSSYREVSSGPAYEQLQRVGARISKAVGKNDYEWQFVLLDDPQINAFALPGGKVAVYTGILPVAQNEDGLATIVGHEIAHVVARHGAERVAHQTLAQLGGVAMSASVGEMAPEKQRLLFAAFGMGTQVGVLLPFSRKHESEADFIGLQYLTDACYNPEEAPRLWERMGSANRGAPPEFLSTHPNPSTRVAQFQEWLPKARETYRNKCRVG